MHPKELALREKLSHIRSLIEDMESDARQLWVEDDCEESFPNSLQDIADAIAELETQ